MTQLVVCKDLIKLVHALHTTEMEGDVLLLPKFRGLQVAVEAGEEVAWAAQLLGLDVPEKGTDAYLSLAFYISGLVDALDPAAELLTQDGRLEEGIYIYHGVDGFKLATPEELERLPQ